MQRKCITKWMGTQRDKEGVGDVLGNGIPDYWIFGANKCSES